MEKNTILMIDDDTHLLDLYKARLEREGFAVLTAADGEDGLKVALKENPNLIVLDIVMPKKDGLETLQEIKSLPIFGNTPIIMLSSLSSREKISRALELGAVTYLVKAHTTPSDLVKKIQEILPR